MGKLSEEIAAYEGMRNLLETDHLGKWVIVHGGKLEGTYETAQEAADEAVAKFGRGPYLIRQVGAAPMSLHRLSGNCTFDFATSPSVQQMRTPREEAG